MTNTKIESERYKRIFNGIDVKRFQYEEYATNLSHKQINLTEIISKHLFEKKVETNCVMINLEKDAIRYENTLKEFQKISVVDFSHLKATYWKEKENLKKDLEFVIDFLSQFNTSILSNKIEINEFSEINDPNIHIQDGPLACYVSHLRSMIYGYTNFKDYTIIVEDDISITNTEFIEKYLAEMPDDWDIVMLNACSKNKIYDQTLYKFTDEFHSTHFYIINHKCFPKIFKNLYPITDQVDVLLSNLYKDLNIYNIQETVFQKNISTNTQNNLYVISNSPHYEGIRKELVKIKDCINFFTNSILFENESINEIITLDLIYDIIYEYVLNFNPNNPPEENVNKETFDCDIEKYYDYNEFHQLIESLRFFLQCSKKGITGEIESISLLKTLFFTIENFKLHNTIDEEFFEKLKALSFGSTAHTYLLEKNNIVVKRYNKKLRFISEDHNSSSEIFEKELTMLQKVEHLTFSPKIKSFDKEEMIIKMEYVGKSLWEDFNLPKDWESQIRIIFNELDKWNIFYPEFRLQNILVKDGKISFIDFGLAKMDYELDNTTNLNRFIKYLKILQPRISLESDRNKRLQLITTFLLNAEILNI
jgi:tRNA A-37 threonylcarbamoyl transferase component Bud32/GR25 family glycosyltransferase involved in LPS biosynthesis